MSAMRAAVEAAGHAAQELAADLAEAVMRRGWSVATAESLTGGTVAGVLSAAPSASDWFRGSVVAYSAEVKFSVLAVPRGPVITEECAATMASEAAQLLGADLAVAVTGVGGPEPSEGEPAGTVWFAVASRGGIRTQKVVFDGSPTDVLVATGERALKMLNEAATGAA